MACSFSARPNDPSLMRLAPNVFVSRMSAPARTYSSMHGEHDLRLREVQRVEALVDEHALRVQHRPHCPIADEDSLLERVGEWLASGNWIDLVIG